MKLVTREDLLEAFRRMSWSYSPSEIIEYLEQKWEIDDAANTNAQPAEAELGAAPPSVPRQGKHTGQE
jgi:hypothetical protein